MDDPAILFVKPKAISEADKKRLSGAGVIVVEVADPRDVKLVRAHAELPQSALLMAATRAISEPGVGCTTAQDVRLAFAENICDAITKRHPQ